MPPCAHLTPGYVQKRCRNNSLPVMALIVDSCPECTASMNLINIPIQRFTSLSLIPGSTVAATAQQVWPQPCRFAALNLLLTWAYRWVKSKLWWAIKSQGLHVLLHQSCA